MPLNPSYDEGLMHSNGVTTDKGVLDWLHAGKFGAHIPDSVGWGWWKEHKLELEGAWILTPVLPFEL
jgi:hypothetical protein